MAGSYRDLLVWRKSIAFVLAIYRATEAFPPKEQFGLTSQLRRAAVSVPSNIAEGQAHHSHPDFKRFLRLAKGSLAEIDTQLIIAFKLDYIGKEQATELSMTAAELGRMLSGLLAKLKD